MAGFETRETLARAVLLLIALLTVLSLTPVRAQGTRASIISPVDNEIYTTVPQVKVEVTYPGGIIKSSIRASIDGVSITSSDWGSVSPSGSTAEVYELTANLSNLVSTTEGEHVLEVLEAFSATVPSIGIIESPVSVTFKVDTVSPSILGVTPGDQAEVNDLTPMIEIRFSEPMNPASLSGIAGTTAAIVMTAGTQTIAGRSQWAEGYTVLYFEPQQEVVLDSSGEVDVSVRIGDLKDAAGNSLSSDFTRNFKVSVPTMAAPYVSATWPVDNQTSIDDEADIVINFSKSINKDTLINRITMMDGSRVLTYPGSLESTNAASSNIFSFTLSSDYTPMKGNTLHTVVIKAGVTATDGTIMAQDYTFSFQTAESVTIPTSNLSLLYWRPDSGEEVHTLRPALSFRFNRVLDTSTIATGFSITDAMDRTGEIVMTDDGKGFSFVPGMDFVPGKTYTWTVKDSLSGGILDIYGKGLGSQVTSTFVVAQVPHVISTVPTDGSMAVNLQNEISVLFNVSMDSTTLSTTTVKVFMENQAIAISNPTLSGSTLKFSIDNGTASAYMNKLFTVVLSSQIKDVYGMALGEDVSFSFTSTGDSQRPLVSTTYPAVNDQDVVRNPLISVEFSEAMDTTIAMNTAFQIVAENSVETVTLKAADGTVTWNSAGTIMNFTPTASLPAGAVVKVTLYTSIFRDAAGNLLDDQGDGNLAGDDYQFIFNTINDSPVSIMAVSPESGATEVSSGARISVSFNRAVEQSSVDSGFSVVDSAGQPVPGIISFSDNNMGVNFQPAEPMIQGQITVTLKAGSAGVKAADGDNGLLLTSPGLDGNGDGTAGASPADDFTFTFTVRSPLNVTATSPANGDSQIRRDIKIPVTVSFSHLPDMTTVTPSTIRAFAGDEQLQVDSIAAGTGVNELYMELYLGAKGNFDERTIRIILDSSISDIRGESLQSDYTFSFTVNNPERPLVLEAGVSPAKGAVSVPMIPTIVIPFSEAMDRTSAQQAFSLKASNGAQDVGRSGVFTWSDDGTVMSFVPNQALLEATTYEVTIADTAQDLSGAYLQVMMTSTFSTLNTVLPSLVTVIPSDGASDIAIDTRITIIFSKPMDLASLSNIVVSADRQVAIDRIEKDPEATSRYIIVPVSLSANSEYTITIPRTVQDTKGNQLDQKYVSKFTTKGIGDLLEVGAFVVPGDAARAVILIQSNESVTDSLTVKVLQRGSTAEVAVTMTKVESPALGKHLYKGIYTINRSAEFMGTAQVLVSARIGGILNSKTEEFIVKE